MANEFPEATARLDLIKREDVLSAIRGHFVLYDDHYKHCLTRCVPELIEKLPAVNSYDALRAAAEAAVKVLQMEFPGSIKRKAAIDQLRVALHPQQEREGENELITIQILDHIHPHLHTPTLRLKRNRATQLLHPHAKLFHRA